MKENERIKHIKAFKAELKLQQHAIANKDAEREKEIQREELEKLARQVEAEEQRL